MSTDSWCATEPKICPDALAQSLHVLPMSTVPAGMVPVHSVLNDRVFALRMYVIASVSAIGAAITASSRSVRLVAITTPSSRDHGPVDVIRAEAFDVLLDIHALNAFAFANPAKRARA